MLCSRCHQPWRRPQIERPEHRSFRIRHFVRQFLYHAPVSADLARWRFSRRGIRKLSSCERQSPGPVGFGFRCRFRSEFYRRRLDRVRPGCIIQQAGSAPMSEPDVDHYRYRALLKAADDEPKRLALIQLLIGEGARDKLAAKSKVAEPETPLPQPRPFMLRAPTAEAPPQEATPSSECESLGEDQISSTAADVSMKFADLAARLSLRAHELESPAFPSHPPEPKSYTEPSIESEPQNVVATFETATGD